MEVIKIGIGNEAAVIHATEEEQLQLTEIKEWYKTLSDEQIEKIKVLLTVTSNCPIFYGFFDEEDDNEEKNCDDCSLCWTMIFEME